MANRQFGEARVFLVQADDRRLHRLLCYIHHSQDVTLQSCVGDQPEDCRILICYDASLADSLRNNKSTSGAFLANVWPNTFAPIMSYAKEQSAVSHSSTESEVSSLEEAVLSDRLLILTFWEQIVMLLAEINPMFKHCEHHATQHQPPFFRQSSDASPRANRKVPTGASSQNSF